MNQSGVIVSPRFGSTRFSIHFFNSSDDVSFALDTLERVLATGGPVARDRHTEDEGSVWEALAGLENVDRREDDDPHRRILAWRPLSGTNRSG